MPDDQDGLDDDGRLQNKGIAEAVAQAITGQVAVVISYSRKEGKRQAPMPFALSDLQKAASQRHGLSAAQTLEAAQKLYEAGISTYPRTDCSYLPEEQHGDAARILEKLHIPGADPQRKHLAWNTTKVEAHHGIMPTGQPLPPDATSAMQQIFSLIAESYARLFFPPELYEQRDATFEIAGRRFVARSRVVTDPGWTRIGANNDAEEPDEAEDDGQIPVLQRGEQKHCERGELVGKTTTPPKPYNDGTLIAAMTRIHTLVEDPKLKARLKETSGLGTEATRAGTIETLISREYAERRKKEIRPTQRGIQLVQSLRAAAPSTVDPGVTAIWEDALASVAVGRLPVESFLSKQIEAVRSLTQRILQADLGQLAPAPTGHICPSCNAPLLARSSRKGIAFLACSNEDCNTAWFRNQDGTPGAQIGEQSSKTPESLGPACPVCKAETGRFLTRTQKGYFRCPSGHGSWWDDNGKLGKEWEARKPVQASRNQRRSK
jgi:DNA topoisomerase-3